MLLKQKGCQVSRQVEKEYAIDDLRYLMRRLRDPDTGCPWDIKQNYKTIVPYTLEEVYEVVDTIERGDYEHLREELGDLLFQIIFYCQLGEEEGLFRFSDIVTTITAKLVHRHPHVFPDGTLKSKRDAQEIQSETEIKKTWEDLKKQERENKGKQHLLDDIPIAMPAMNRAYKMQKRAALEGFDWPGVQGVFDKLSEEVTELEKEIEKNDVDAIEEEMGDILFTCVNLARHLSVDPEKALRAANNKFQRRFDHMESLSENTDLASLSMSDLETLWLAAKKGQ